MWFGCRRRIDRQWHVVAVSGSSTIGRHDENSYGSKREAVFHEVRPWRGEWIIAKFPEDPEDCSVRHPTCQSDEFDITLP